MKFLFALLGVALAAYSSNPQGRLFKSQTEYRFRYESSISSGIHLSQSEAAFTRHRSDVTLQILDDRVALLQLKNVQFANENVQTSETSEMIPFDRLEKQELTEEHKSSLELPVRFHFRQGLISELQFFPEEQQWSANIKRSIINMLQVNWEKISQKDEEYSTENFFTVMEKTIEGECEVAYNLSPESGKFFITKSVNFDKCENRVEIAYNQRYASENPEYKQKLIAPQTVYTYKIEKEQLKEVELNSVYSVSLKDQTLMKTKIQARLVLKETSEIRREIESPKGETSELMYSTKFDQEIEEFLKKGDEAERNPLSIVPRKVEMLKEIVEKLSELKEESQAESADYFMRFVQYVRLCNEQELRQVMEKVYHKADRRTKSIVESGLAVAGSRNTVKQVLRLAEELSVPQTIQLLKSIQETAFPSEQIADLLLQFSKTEKCRKEPAVRQTVWLAYGAMVRGAIGHPLEKSALRPSENFKTKAMNVLKKQWENAESVYEKVLAIKSVANSGLDISVHLLEKVIMDKKQPTIVRMEAIDALRLLSEQMPRKIHKILMPIYSNRLEKNEIRMAALHQIMQAKPQLPELSQVVLRMEREPNQHIAAFTYHMLTTVAESQLPIHRNISSYASTLLRNSLYRPEQRFLSIFKSWSVFNKETYSGFNINFGSVFGKDSSIPKDMMASLETLVGGQWNKYLAQIGFSQQNVEALFNKVLSKLNKLEKKENYSRASRVSKSISMVKDIARKLNLRLRESTTEEPFAMLYIRYKQMDYAVLPIDEQIIDEMIQKYLDSGKIDTERISRYFSERQPEHEFTAAGFFIDSMAKITNSLGLPMVLYQKQPTVFGWNGKMSWKKTSDGIRLRLEAQPTVGSMHYHSLQVWTPAFVNGIKHIRSVEMTIPVDVEIEFFNKREITVEFRQRMPEDKKTLLRVESRPVCYVRYFKESTDRFNNFNEKTITSPKLQRWSQEKNMKYEVAGVEFWLSGSVPSVWTLENVLLGEHQFELTIVPTRRTPKEISARFVIERVGERLTIEEPKIEKMLRKEMTTEEGEWESRSESSRREHLNKLVRELELNNGYKYRVQATFRGLEKYNAEFTTECDGKLNFWRIIAELKPEERNNFWNIWSKTEVILPRSVSSIQELKEQKHREVQLYSEWKWGSDEKIEINAQWEQSKMQRNMVQKVRELRGLAAYEHLYRLARLNQIKANVDYKLSPKTEQYFEKVFALLKGYTYWSSKIESSEHEPRRVVLQVTSEPMLSGLYNMTIQTPESFFRAQNVHLPYVPAYCQYSIARQPKNSLRHSPLEKSECKIEESRVNTFDDVIYRAPLSNCYTVFAKDCSEESRYAVLIKNARKNGEEKKVKIIFEETEYEMEVNKGELKATVEGKTVRRESDYEKYSIEKIGDMYVVDLGEIVVHFDGYTVKVLLNNGQMAKQCGLCGNMEGEKDYKYRTATGEETDDLEKYHRSYMVDSKECPAVPSQKKHYKEYEYEQESTSEYNYDYEWPEKKQENRPRHEKSEEYDEEKKETEPIRKYLIKEKSHRICISVDTVPQCPKGTNAEKTSEKKVEFTCWSRQDSEARRLVKAIRRGDSVEVTGEVEYTETITVPRTCSVY